MLAIAGGETVLDFGRRHNQALQPTAKAAAELWR